jgi:tRNA A-37 threonylcarbamoyl transferase component Bud32
MTEHLGSEPSIAGFEQAWLASEIPPIRTYLDNNRPITPQQTRALLMELINIDLEFRWKSRALKKPDRLLVEDYLQDFPELGSAGQVPIGLVAEEYRARRQWGDKPNHESYFQRFPAHVEELARVLRDVDQELRREQTSPREGLLLTNDVDAGTNASQKRNLLKYSDYLLHEMIGSGQMGRVYRATHEATGRQVSTKFLRKTFLQDRAAVRRFLREADIVSGLTHDGIVRVEGVGTTPGGGYFIVMEHLPGPDLTTIITSGPVSIVEAVRWTMQAAEAVAYANASGIIHCDLKPGNLVLDQERNARVTDFGLAISIDDDHQAFDRIAGTAPFMAPEQVSAWWGKIGPHTDVYGLGCVLYALTTGRAPFEGSTVTDVLSRVVSGIQPVAPDIIRPELGRSLAAVLHRCLSKSLSSRYQSAAELLHALRNADLS